jgi:hypothetical protein
MNRFSDALLFAVLVVLSANTAAASLATGDTFVFRVFNGYNNEVRGQIQYHIDRIDADRIAESVSPGVPALGLPRAEIYTKEGNWLRHTLTNHDQLVEYEFSPPFPAYVFPLESSKSWSLRVTATNPATGRRNSVRVDGEVLGNERITTPAGTFDTIKVTRRVYAGDWAGFLAETHIIETDWYAPALGRPVKSNSKSAWNDTSRCMDDGGCGFDGDWNISELMEIRPVKP